MVNPRPAQEATQISLPQKCRAREAGWRILPTFTITAFTRHMATANLYYSYSDVVWHFIFLLKHELQPRSYVVFSHDISTSLES